MSPSDKNKPAESSMSGESQSQEGSKSQLMDPSSESASSSTSDVTIPGHGMIANIPLITASLPTLKCSINNQMKTFDPGEDGGTERLSLNHSSLQGKISSSSLLKNSSKNYKAGSKINKLADMLAKRSQSVVEVTQNNATDIITDISSAPKVEGSVILNNVRNMMSFGKSFESSVACFEKTANDTGLGLFRKSRRKSVPNQSCNVHRLQVQSTSKSCSDFSKLFPIEENSKPEFNALGESLTDESTKKKVVKKNLKNVELPLILPERKRRSSMRNEHLTSSKVIDKILDISASGSPEETDKNKETVAASVPSPIRSVISTKIKKENRGAKQRKSKRLVETSTQTADIEFISVLKSKPEVVEEGGKPSLTYECLYCTQTFPSGSQCKAHEKTHTQKNNNKQIIKCQYCFKKLPSLDELKFHCVQKHPNKYAYCMKCDERFATKEELYSHNKETHFNKSGEGGSQNGEGEDLVAGPQSKPDAEEKQTEKKTTKQNGAKTDLKIDVSFDTSKKSSVSPRNVQKFSPKETKTEEQLLEMEMLFYSHLSGNIQENLTNHLDGKLDKSGNPVRTDQIHEQTDSAKSSSLLSVVAPSAGVPDVQVSRAPSPYQTRSKTPNPLPPTAKKFKKLPNWQQKFWEKYNFPTNYRYEHRFWDKNYLNTEKSAFYLKDLSCLDIKTQLTMRENIKKLDNIKSMEENSKPTDKLKFPDYLLLVPRVSGGGGGGQENKSDAQRSSEQLKNKKQVRKEEQPKKSFKSPGSEVAVMKTRRKLSSDNSSAKKQQGEKSSTEGVKMMTRRQSSLDLAKEDREEGGGKKRKGSLDMSGNQRMSLRRQTSLDCLQGNSASKSERNDQILEFNLNNVDLENTSLSPTSSAEISGEWVRPRSYLCGTCCTKFTNLWELEDHKWVSHPNVWCTHYEFEDEKIDKLFQNNGEEEVGKDGSPGEPSALKLMDLYKRYLLPHGSLKTAKLVPNSNFPEQCTKCKKNSMNSSEMHKHMLDCGGDTTWFLTMYSSPMTIKRKWRPFGSRRRKQIGRRDLKRNIPSTPSLRPYHYQHRIRTKPGDVESIQKMLANLPEKRARRAINFDEIKTRSQATIRSNRLLRKRFKTTFTNNFLKMKNLKQKRQLKQGKKEGSSKSTTDTSSENTPVGSPKRRNKLKERLQLLKEETSREGSIESSGDTDSKSGKRRTQNKKKEAGVAEPRIKTEKPETEKGKPATRSNGVLGSGGRSKKKTPSMKKEMASNLASESENNSIAGVKTKSEKSLIAGVKTKSENSNIAGVKTKSKKSKKKSDAVVETKIKEEPKVGEVSRSVLENEATPKLGKKAKHSGDKKKRKSQWVNSRQSNSILRLNQKSKEKTELLKKIKKKLENSKRTLELKELKNAEFGSRRSLRLRSLRSEEGGAEIPEDQLGESTKKEESVCQKDFKIRNPIVSLGNLIIAKSVKAPGIVSVKSLKENGQREEKAAAASPEDISLRRSSRSLRNSVSLEEKPEVTINGDCIIPANANKVSILRRNSKALSETTDTCPPLPDVIEDFVAIKRPPRIPIIRSLRTSLERPEPTLVNGQISLLKKNRFAANPRLVRGPVKLEENSEAEKLDSGKNSDLEEMPILARVEPLRGKNSNKGEKDIPVLLPVEKERREDSDEETTAVAAADGDSVSFQIVKKRRKTPKEVTPLKIVKKIETATLEIENGFPKTFRIDGNNDSNVNGTPEFGKARRKKFTVSPVVDNTEKKTKTDVKKYFLGICPSEIDKGRKDLGEESGSDSEPLISLVMSQNQKENEAEVDVKKEEVTEKEEERNKSEKKDNEGEEVEEHLQRVSPPPLITPEKTEEDPVEIVHETQVEKPVIILEKKFKISEKNRKKKKIPKKAPKRLRVTVTLKEPTLKIVDKSVSLPTESKWTLKPPTETNAQPETKSEEPPLKPEETPPEVSKELILPERRSRRISKETKSSSEFIIDDPLILVDELWSDLDSDSDSSKKKSKKGKKKTPKKRSGEEKRISDVNLEELLRNFGENKENNLKKIDQPPKLSIKLVSKPKRPPRVIKSWAEVRKTVENREDKKSYRRLSLKLFRFNKAQRNLGNLGEKLSEAKRAAQQRREEAKDSHLPDLPFLAAEIKENPVQVIQCRAQKAKTAKRGSRKVEPKHHNGDIRLKISLPLESINNMAVFNNNNITELGVEEGVEVITVAEESSQSKVEMTSQAEELPVKEVQPSPEESFPSAETAEAGELKNKSKRSEVIDKIFYCEICKTYYYSSSQLKIHKLSNRHKLKESELLLAQQEPETVENVKMEQEKDSPVEEPIPVVENVPPKSSEVEKIEVERLNDDTLEMPTLEGPFIENPLTRLGMEPFEPPPQPPIVNNFGFSQESLKDIQRAIGCTDEEMLILTLLGENTIEIENDILDLDTCKPVQPKSEGDQEEKVDGSHKETEKANGALKLDLKQRMTSALACLVNKAVFNLLQKYETAAKTAVNPEALSLLGKLSRLSRRKNILQLNELLKKQNDGESSIGPMPKEFEKKEPTISYKYQCTICGSRFEKASTRECHISRSHKGKAKKLADDAQVVQAPPEEDWNDSWSYDAGDDHLGGTNTSQFWCSDCGINFLSPQEVLEHQKLEHQAGAKETESNKDAGPLQSSTIGSSDEIIEGKKPRRRPKLFSSEELDQQRIIANNELRKLDRKFTAKNKTNKIKWGMDALRFTVEKENKIIMEKEVRAEDAEKPPVDLKNIDLVPKLNLSRTSNIPEFKVIQKNSLKNRFQKIIDNKLKRKNSLPSQQEAETDEVETEVMLVPVVVKKKNKKQKAIKYATKKGDGEKPVDVYDFNESESEGEPVVFSHVKKPALSPTKLKLVKVKEGPSKNKADSTTKDLAPDDYDSEDSLPLSVVKKSKPEDEDDEKVSEDGVEKSEGILEQVEYLIEQLENETGSSNKQDNVVEDKKENDPELKADQREEFTKDEVSKDSTDLIPETQASLRVSVANKFLELDNIPLKNPKIYKINEESLDASFEDERGDEAPEREESILAEPETSQSTFDEEDSMPLVMMSKKVDETKRNEEKKCDENTTDVSTTASEDVHMFGGEERRSSDAPTSLSNLQTPAEESLPPVFSSSENEGEKSDKPFKTVNGNVIYCRNESVSDFGSDLSNDGLIHTNFDKISSEGNNFIKEVTEKEDVVIVCSKGDDEDDEDDDDDSKEEELGRKRMKPTQRKRNEILEPLRKKKKRFPLLTATIEENNFRKSESPKLNKEVIVRKIWSRQKLAEESTDNDADSFASLDNENSVETNHNDESQAGLEKEIIVKKIWSRKKVDHEEESGKAEDSTFEDVKINQTEISDEVVIKCGPKTKASPKRRKSRGSTNEASKETIMRKIWSGRCTFQTKAALKTYDSDMIPNCKENEGGEPAKPKKRGRPPGFGSAKRSRAESEADKDDEDDLDSLLEEIEREQLEKAIRLEFLQLRRSEKANVEIMKEGSNPTVGLFTETSLKHKKEISDRKRRKVRKKLKHPRQSVLKRKKFLKKPIRRIRRSEERSFSESSNRTNADLVMEQSENLVDKCGETFGAESKIKNRKHKKHRHKHHHHKHKHKKSKHRKCIVSKHKSKHKFDGGEGATERAESFSILEKICQDMPAQIEPEIQFQGKASKRRTSPNLNNSDSKIDDVSSPLSFENKTKDCEEVEVEDGLGEKTGTGNIYEFVE